MHGVLAAVLAAAEVDPDAMRPSPLTSVVVGFLLVATALLIWSFLRHLRRAQANLGPARATTADPSDTGTDPVTDTDPDAESP